MRIDDREHDIEARIDVTREVVRVVLCGEAESEFELEIPHEHIIRAAKVIEDMRRTEAQ